MTAIGIPLGAPPASAALGRLRRLRTRLVVAALAGAVLRGLATLLGLVAAGAVADLALELPTPLRTAMLPAAVLGALLVAAVHLARARGVRDLRELALWIEAREPALRYALVTRLDPAGDAQAVALERAIAPVPFERPAERAAWRAAVRPLVATIVAAVALLLLPHAAVARVAPAVGDAIARSTARPVDPLASVTVRVVPPAYTGLPAATLRDPASLAAVVGSRVTIEGAGEGDVVARLDSDMLRVSRDDGWRVALAMPGRASVLRLSHGTRERLLLLEPRPDSLPVVSLVAPARDTVFRAPSGVLPLLATVRDDFGVADAWFDVVVSSGEGESFTFRTLTLGRSALGGARSAERRLRLVLDSLALKPGDVVHLRAVARDRRTIGGPGVGASETRALRIARVGEGDSVSVEALPPTDSLKTVLSQRMLIMLAESLVRKRPRMARERFVNESRRIGRDQDALRRQVGDIVFQRLEGDGEGEHAHGAGDGHDHGAMSPEQLLAAASAATDHGSGEALDFAGDESPVVAINRPLLEAYNAMWEAGRELAVGEPKRALPHMYAALAAIQRARAAERIYLRGPTRAAVVDIARVRLAGKRDGIAPSLRTPRTAEDEVIARRLARFDRAVLLASRDAGAAADSLLLLRAELLGETRGNAAAAAPLGEALERLRLGRDATDALVATRRALAGERGGAMPAGAWSVALPGDRP